MESVLKFAESAGKTNECIGQFKVGSDLRNRCRLWGIQPYYNEVR
jgi:hypothetical protein